MLEEGVAGELPDRAASIVSALRLKSHAISTVIDDLLEDARLTDGRLHLSRRVVDLREIARRAVADASAVLPDTHELLYHEPDQRVEVDVDPGRVGTILRNLLDNAVKYSPDGGRVDCSVLWAEPHALVVVADEGVGISVDAMERLFRRFGRDAANDGPLGGVGLGLYLCRKLARLHGGDVEVARRPVRGTEFTLRLPLVTSSRERGRSL